MKRIISVILLSAILICGCSCANKAEPDVPGDVQSDVQAEKTPAAEPVAATEPITDKGVDGDFDASYENFCANLLRLSYDSTGGNTLVSPLSAMLALALAVNGAEGKTKEQLISLFGTDDLDSFNKSVFAYVNSMRSMEEAKLAIADSAWFFDKVNQSYIDDIVNLYNAQIFADMPKNKKTLNEINEWVRENTDGMIDRLFDDDYEISGETVAMLINAVCFEAEWKEKYFDFQVVKEKFTDISGNSSEVDMMKSTESEYICLDDATGFKKPYEGGYSFVALLPNEGVDINSFVASLNGEKLEAAKKTESNVIVHAALPKFTYDYNIPLNDILRELGVTDAFDPSHADFSKIQPGVFIDSIIQKTKIELDEWGTKAAAVTEVLMCGNAAPDPEIKEYTVTLDRPFVYMIVHGKSSHPLFIGTVTNIEQ